MRRHVSRAQERARGDIREFDHVEKVAGWFSQ
jgi:hypothetical protein